MPKFALKSNLTVSEGLVRMDLGVAGLGLFHILLIDDFAYNLDTVPLLAHLFYQFLP